MEKRIYTKESIKELLLTNDKAVARGVLAIFKHNQTEQEQVRKHTMVYNGIGFNSVDSRFLSSVAKFYEDKKFLTPKQLDCTRKKLLKYSGQLAEIANFATR